MKSLNLKRCEHMLPRLWLVISTNHILPMDQNLYWLPIQHSINTKSTALDLLSLPPRTQNRNRVGMDLCSAAWNCLTKVTRSPLVVLLTKSKNCQHWKYSTSSNCFMKKYEKTQQRKCSWITVKVVRKRAILEGKSGACTDKMWYVANLVFIPIYLSLTFTWFI